MNAQDIRNLQEAYMEVVENQQLDEISTELAKRAGEERMNRTFALMQKDWKEGKKKPSSEFQKSYKKQQDDEKRYRKKLQKEQVDLYDIIFSHLLDEGYAETPEAAEAIMVNMSEDWRESICEELTGERKKRALEKGGYLANRVASGKEGQPVERRNRSGDITMRTTGKGPTKRGGIGFKGRTKSDWYGTDDAHGSGNKSRRRRGIEVKDTSDDL